MTSDKPVKKRINSKAKGKGFENDIAKLLSKTFNPYTFKRVLHSGAILGGKNVSNINQYSTNIANQYIGDVVCVNEADYQEKYFRFNLECKFYKTPETLDNFLGVVNSNIPKWFEESVIDAKKTGKTPLLIVKYNRSSVYCVINDQCKLPSSVSNYVYLSKDNLFEFLLNDALIDKVWWFNFNTFPLNTGGLYER